MTFYPTANQASTADLSLDPTRSLRLGESSSVLPAGRVFLAENHDHAYHLWREQGIQDRILVHIDAHHDLWWIPEKGAITIANFLCQSLRDHHARELIWVVPDATWESRKSRRRPLLDHLKALLRAYPDGTQTIEVANGHISASLLGKPLRICPLASLPRFAENVLLDIDVDFFLIPRVSFREWDKHAAVPWCWPEELVGRLAARGLHAELATIAYSVEGGYTPLQWKYLGDELALRLQGSGSEDEIRGLRLMREAALAAHRREPAAAETLYRQAALLLPASAAAPFHLAHLCADTGRLDEARKFYQQALSLDPSYRTPYSNSGLWHLWDRRFRRAERELRRALQLDPGDPYAHYGLGRLTAAKGRWREAEPSFRSAIEANPNLIDAYRWLARSLDQQGRDEEAIESYVHSLRLVLAGHKPLGAPIVTLEEKAHLSDPAHWEVHARLARLYERKGRDQEAIQSCRMAIAGGADGFAVRARLARLYWRKKEWGKAAEQASRAGRRIPRDSRKAMRRIHYRAKRAIEEQIGAIEDCLEAVFPPQKA